MNNQALDVPDTAARRAPAPLAPLGVRALHECASAAALPETLEVQLDGFAGISARVDALAARLILRAFNDAGVLALGAAPAAFDDIAAGLKVLPRHGMLLRRYLAILIEDGLLRLDADGAYTATDAGRCDCEAEAVRLARECPHLEVALALLARCTKAAPGILSGTQPAIAALFVRGSLSQMEQVYQQLPALCLGHLMLRDALAQLCRERVGQPLRILEIGAGTGALSAEVIPWLAERGQVSYAYTDISQLFLAHGREKFARFPFVKTQIVDICNYLLEQGLEPGQFDAVIAANVLHATPDLRRCVDNVKRLLREDGCLLTLETCRPSRFADCTVGLLDGWWSFTDRELRRDYPLIDGPAWEHLLAQAGFNAVAMPVDRPQTGGNPELALVLARPRSGAGRPASDSPAASAPRAAAAAPRRAGVLIFCGHHKAGTVWSSKIFATVCRKLGMRGDYFSSPRQFDFDLAGHIRKYRLDFVCYANADPRYLSEVADYRGVHVFRDPRDTVVSGYFSHRNSHPERNWPELAGHRQRLRELPLAEGMRQEIGFSATLPTDGVALNHFEALRHWNYGDARMLELKFETLTASPLEGFRRIFEHLGLAAGEGAALPPGLLEQVVADNDFAVLAGGRRRGEEDTGSHYRKGVPGDWVHYFDDATKAEFKRLWGDLVVALGYEADHAW